MQSTTNAGGTGTRGARLALLPVLVAGVLASALPVSAAEDGKLPGCTAAGIDWNRDPVFRASLHHSDREHGIRQITCVTERIQDLRAGDTQLRLVLGQIHNGTARDPKLTVKLVDILKVEGQGARSIGRVFLGPDQLDGQLNFEPQAAAVDGSVVIRLSRRHRWLFQLKGEALTSFSAFSWRDALDPALAAKVAGGDNLGIDIEKREGRIAVRSDARDPKQSLPGTADPNTVLIARLGWKNGGLVVEEAGVAARLPGEEPFLDEIDQAEADLRKKAADLPRDVEACAFGAWSMDTDPKGLNVRAAPDARSKILGIVPPPRLLRNAEDSFGKGPVRSEFRVLGYRTGWFLIEGIEAPGARYNIPALGRQPKPYAGRGWVSASKIGGALAFGGVPAGRLYVSPHADASFNDVVSTQNTPIGAGDVVKKIEACSGSWALVETAQGKRGWWRGVCSNQVTNCS